MEEQTVAAERDAFRLRDGVDVALDVGTQILISEGEISRVEDTVSRISRAYGAERVDVFAITSLIVISVADRDGNSMTLSRRIYGNRKNMRRVEEMNALSRRICADPVSPAEAKRLFGAAMARSAPVIWMRALGAILVCCSFTAFFGGSMGDCLAAVLEAAGFDVSREFYINDAGNQINKFGASLSVRYMQLFEGEEKHPLPEDCYQGMDILDHAREFAKLYGDKYVNAPEEERRKALVDYALPLNIAALERDLGKYRIHYDVWFRESLLHQQGKVMAICEKLRENGYAYEKEGALWYNNIKMMSEKAEKAGKPLTEAELAELKDDVLVRANGVPTYFAADIAYHYNKFAERGFHRVINVWGADHHGHVARLKGAMDALGLDGDRLDIVLMQLVRLMKDGQPYRMSKRSGRAVTLTDLLGDVPIDAARFFFNMREPNATFDFDLDLAVQQSSENPVYYVQYAHARICSVLKLVLAEGMTEEDILHADLGLLTTPEERELCRALGQMPDEVIAAAKYYDPARMTRYAMDVAALYHKFYQNCRVKCEDSAVCAARAALCRATATVLENTLGMLKITAPDVM